MLRKAAAIVVLGIIASAPAQANTPEAENPVAVSHHSASGTGGILGEILGDDS